MNAKQRRRRNRRWFTELRRAFDANTDPCEAVARSPDARYAVGIDFGGDGFGAAVIVDVSDGGFRVVDAWRTA